MATSVYPVLWCAIGSIEKRLQQNLSRDGIDRASPSGTGIGMHVDQRLGPRAAESLVLKIHGPVCDASKFGREPAREFGLRTLGAVHVQRQPDDEAVGV